MSTESRPEVKTDPPTHGPRKGLMAPLHFVLRGLAISLPTVLTIVILMWIARGVNTYLIYPATSAVKWVLAQPLDKSVEIAGLERLPSAPELERVGRNYLVTPSLKDEYVREAARRRGVASTELLPESIDEWLTRQAGVYVPFTQRAVPYEHYLVIARQTHENEMPRTSTGFYMDYAAERSFGSLLNLSLVAIILILVLLYFLGRFVSVRLGAWIVHKIEDGILGRLPVIRSVYGSVKQVSDFLFSENQVEYRRVVAIEYPRRGIWSLGLVTGDSMMDITVAVGEPCVSVLVPSSPMPVTGYTMSVPRSHLLDLNMSVDQAMQFCISCGVLVPRNRR
ncbi:MAG: DUF502 domain-containing protein [Planctomycetaceae bacterium]